MTGISGFVVVSFVTVNTLRTLAYLPQIWAALRHPESTRGISVLTWSYFAVAHLTGVAYSLVVTHDANLVASFLGNFFACTLLVVVVAWQRRGGAVGAAMASGARSAP